MQLISTWVKSLTGIILIIMGAMIPAAIVLPQKDLSISIIDLQSSWQLQGILLSSILCGPIVGTISVVSYLFIGLFYLPIFHGGGSVGYLLIPEFSYLIGFVPLAWICGSLSANKKSLNLIDISKYSIFSLLIFHLIGMTNLTIGHLIGIWNNNLIDLIYINTLAPLPSQVILCIAVSLISLVFRHLLLIK